MDFDTTLMPRLVDAQHRAEARMLDGSLPAWLALRWSIDAGGMKVYAQTLGEHVRGHRAQTLPESLWTAGFLTALELVAGEEAGKS